MSRLLSGRRVMVTGRAGPPGTAALRLLNSLGATEIIAQPTQDPRVWTGEGIVCTPEGSEPAIALGERSREDAASAVPSR